MADTRFDLEKVPPPDEAPLARPGYPRPAGYPDAGSYGYGHGWDNKINFRNMWRVVRKRMWLILLIIFITTCIATLEVYRTKSLYEASASIEIRKDATTLIKTGDLVVQTDDFDTINTYTYLLTSKPLLQDVAASLRLSENPNFFDVTQKRSVMEAIGTVLNRIRRSNPVEPGCSATTPEVAMRDDIARTPEERTKLAPSVGVLTSNVNISQLPNTRVLIVSFTHTDPQIAASVTNALAQAFINRSYKNKTQKYSKASDWLDVSTRKLRAQVEQADQELADYTRTHNIIVSDNKDGIATDKYLRLHEQVMRAETERTLKETLLEQVKAGKVSQLPEAFTDADTKELQRKLGELRVQAAELDVNFGPKHPKMLETKQKIAVLEQQIGTGRKSLEEKIKADYERAVRDEQSLKVLLESAKAEAAQQNQDNIKFSLIKQNADTAKTLYTEFLQKTNQANIQLAEQENNMWLAEPAEVPMAPVGPNRLRAILISMFLSLSAGVGLAFFLEYIDNTVKTVEDVTRYAQLPALSVIPAITSLSSPKLLLKGKGKKALAAAAGQSASAPENPPEHVEFDSSSTAAEAYRVLRTSILLSAAGSPPKTILVTSGQPSEGKTTTVINTAISLAQLGSSVLIVDADLRRPSVHKVFGVDDARGLSTYLSRDIEMNGLIQKLQIPNLSLLPGGPVPPNPAELISSERMKNMLKSLREQYDHILIDSPPLINVTDPVILSTLADGVILVVHSGKSTRNVIQRTRQELTSVGAKIFGVVLNNVDLKREGYDYYYYSRYYSAYYGQHNGDHTTAE